MFVAANANELKIIPDFFIFLFVFRLGQSALSSLVIDEGLGRSVVDAFPRSCCKSNLFLSFRQVYLHENPDGKVFFASNVLYTK